MQQLKNKEKTQLVLLLPMLPTVGTTEQGKAVCVETIKIHENWEKSGFCVGSRYVQQQKMKDGL